MSYVVGGRATAPFRGPSGAGSSSQKEARRRSTAECVARVIAHILERLVAARTRQTNR